MSSDIKVSVCVITYNQEKYIAECLQSLVDQETDFKFEIIVGEDCSTDNTREIVENFSKKYPDLIVRNFHVENVGAVQNAITTYKMAKGEYIAHVDGDDLVLPDKLQTQADILDANPDCVICSHDMKLIDSNGVSLKKSFREYKEGKCTLMDLYETLPFFAHSSKMFVNDLHDEYWSKLHPQALDVEVHVEQAKKGYIFHINEQLGVYRSGVGISSETQGVNPILPEGIDRIFKDATSSFHKDNSLLNKLYAHAYLKYAYQAAVANNKYDFIKYTKKSLSLKVFSFQQVFISTFILYPTLFLKFSQWRKRARYRQSI